MVLELRTNPSANWYNTTDVRVDLSTGMPIKYITKQEIQARQKLFQKTPKERAKLVNMKALYKAEQRSK